MSGPTKRLKQCATCRKRVGFVIDERSGQMKLVDHAMQISMGVTERCEGSGKAVTQR